MNKSSLLSQAANSSFESKVERIQKKCELFHSPEEKYHWIIHLGKALPRLSAEFCIEENLVRGCQSKLYLHAEFIEGKIFFSASSDALISAGLAALLMEVYNGESIETILTKPPRFLETLGIYASLSPNRSNGLLHIYLKMKQQSISKISTAKGNV